MVEVKITEKIDWLKILGGYGILKQDFDIAKAQLSKKFKQEPSNQDIILSLFHQLIAKNKNDLHKLKMIYYEMALFLNEQGKECTTELQLSHKMQLMMYKKVGIKMVKVLTCGAGACEQCRLLQEKSYTITEALEKMPIPPKNCTTKMYNENQGFCRCCYVASY